MEITPAILMRKNRFSDTSLIVTWLTPDHGKIKTMAKGALRPASRFKGLIDLFFECEIQFARSTKSEIHILREISLENTYENLRKDYSRVALAAYFVELIDLTAEAEHSLPEIYDLLQRALQHLNGKPASHRALEHFESELVRLMGIQHPNLSPMKTLMQVYHRLPSARKELSRLFNTSL